MKHRKSLVGMLVVAAGVVVTAQVPIPCARAAPAPEVEYAYDVMVRRHYNFPGNDAIAYGHVICGEVGQGASYADVIGDVERRAVPAAGRSGRSATAVMAGLAGPGERQRADADHRAALSLLSPPRPARAD